MEHSEEKRSFFRAAWDVAKALVVGNEESERLSPTPDESFLDRRYRGIRHAIDPEPLRKDAMIRNMEREKEELRGWDCQNEHNFAIYSPPLPPSVEAFMPPPGRQSTTGIKPVDAAFNWLDNNSALARLDKIDSLYDQAEYGFVETRDEKIARLAPEIEELRLKAGQCIAAYGGDVGRIKDASQDTLETAYSYDYRHEKAFEKAGMEVPTPPPHNITTIRAAGNHPPAVVMMGPQKAGSER